MVIKQKEEYVRTLDDQLRQGAALLDSQHKQQRESMHQAAEEQKNQFGQQVDRQVKMQEMDLDKQFLQVLQYVKQQATRQRSQLEQQAMQLSFEYQEKKVEEDMLSHQFELSKHQQALKTQMVAQGPLSPLPSYLPPTSSVQMMTTSQVPSNPFASAQMAAIASDAMAPALSYAPLGGSCQTVGYASSSFVPPQSAATAAYSSAAAGMMASVANQSLLGSCQQLPSLSAVPAVTTAFAAPSFVPATVTMAVPTVAATVRTPSYQPVVAAQTTVAPPTAYSVKTVMTPQPSYTPLLSPQPSVANLRAVA
jgi:hypothetical protein